MQTKANDQAAALRQHTNKVNNRQTITKAFGYAFAGLRYFFLHERNGKLQSAAAAAAIGFGLLLHIDANEWVCVLLCIGAVLSLEMINSAVEKLCDAVHPGYHPDIKIVKDVAAGAVLWASIISVLISGFIYLPRIILLCLKN